MTEHQRELERRNQILTAAFKIFTSLGFEKATVEQIAVEAGLSKGAIYWYFESKLAILTALVDQFVQENVDSLSKLVREGRMGPEAIYTVHKILYNDQVCHPLTNSLFGQFCDLAERNPDIQERLLKYHRMWDEAAVGLIESAVLDGKFRDVNALHVSQAIGAMYEGLGMRAKLDPSIDVIGILETATRLFYDALTQSKSSN